MNILLVTFIAFAISSLDAATPNSGIRRRRPSGESNQDGNKPKKPRVDNSQRPNTLQGGCAVDLKTDLSEPQPLVLVKRGLKVDYVNSVDNDGTLRFRADEEFRLACVGKGNHLIGVGNINVKGVAAVCIGNKTIRINSREYEFGTLKCNAEVLSVARRTGLPCLLNFTQIEIGFDLGTEFLRTVEVCRNEELHRTIYVKSNLTKAIGGSQKSVQRPNFRQGDFWGSYKLKDLYTTKKQKKMESLIMKWTGTPTNPGNRYIMDSTYSLAKGHLAPKTDFIYSTAQRSTFWYINSFPQWQILNGGKWFQLERNLRIYATTKNMDLEIYTGTHGILKLPDVNNVKQPLYLYANGTDRALEVPLYFWKIVYDRNSRKGTAFVGVNNPYFTTATIPDYHICTDITTQIPYVRLIFNQNIEGIYYTCTIDDLRRVIPTLPELTVSGILK